MILIPCEMCTFYVLCQTAEVKKTPTQQDKSGDEKRAQPAIVEEILHK